MASPDLSARPARSALRRGRGADLRARVAAVHAAARTRQAQHRRASLQPAVSVRPRRRRNGVDHAFCGHARLQRAGRARLRTRADLRLVDDHRDLRLGRLLRHHAHPARARDRGRRRDLRSRHRRDALRRHGGVRNSRRARLELSAGRTLRRVRGRFRRGGRQPHRAADHALLQIWRRACDDPGDRVIAFRRHGCGDGLSGVRHGGAAAGAVGYLHDHQCHRRHQSDDGDGGLSLCDRFAGRQRGDRKLQASGDARSLDRPAEPQRIGAAAA